MSRRWNSTRFDETPEDPQASLVNLVDIMLVLLIIFLVTIPVIIKSVQITLPIASNIVTVTKPENVVIGVDRQGNFYWNDEPVPTTNDLLERLKVEAVKVPVPEPA